MNRPPYFEARPLLEPQGNERREYLGAADVLHLLRANLRLILSAILCALLLAVAYYLVTPPTYTAQAQLLLDPKLPPVFREASDLGLTVDTGQIETHMVALKSRAIAVAVVKRLELWKDPDFGARPSLLQRLSLMPKRAASAADPVQVAADEFLQNLRVDRDGISQVIDLSYISRDPEKAAKLANETAAAYIQNLLDVRAEASRTASDWLEQRLQQLRLQMNAAAKRAQNFRASNESATLEELQLSAETYRKVYQDFYSAFTEAVQRESYPVSTVRVISPAAVPLNRSSPILSIVFGAAILIGGAIGLLLAILRESSRRGGAAAEGARTW